MSRLRRHFGTAGLLVAVAALIAALGGSAIAANGGGSGDATASAKRGGNVNKLIKRESQKFSKRFSQRFSRRFAIPGPIGPQGFPGLPGAPGEDGDDGDDGDDGSDGSNGTNGTNGTDGTDGKSVEVTPLSVGECANEEGGAEVKQEGAAEGVEVCNGEEGSPWTVDGTLPSGATLTGAWMLREGDNTVALNFPIQLEVGPSPHFVTSEEVEDETAPAECSGSGASPSASSGHLCVYETAQNGTGFGAGILDPGAFDEFFGTKIPKDGAGTTGAILFDQDGIEGEAWGTWAVTG